ncbi:hypothetical protein [uncultured Chloroflexus sp.]|uniref:hypothetical protein n=1 Tax=uncultured Chloroflexus sp. TaxID=214040 RepID=UPI002617CEFB|nr:hypothetical protein [uncultured Chloroflexus sp.]
MNALLICNVGTRDVRCDELPKTASRERQWAQTALAQYDELRTSFTLPIIGKALSYLAERGVVLTQVILIASDQPDTVTFRDSDTVYSAAIIARLLADGLTPYSPLAPDQIITWIIQDEQGRGSDPSDYDGTLRFLERQLLSLAQRYPRHTAFLEVTGGTPAMTTGLLIAGTEAFGGRTEVLSIPPQPHAAPVALNTGRRLLAAPLRATLRSNADTYAYAAAAKTLLEQEAIITDRLNPVAASLLAPLLAYAHHRFNFDFLNARRALEKVQRAGPWQDAINELRAQVTQVDRSMRLAEVVHAAAARYEIGLYADFLTQVVRFEENLLRYLCLQHGARFRNRRGLPDDDGVYLAREWLQRQSFTLSRDRDLSRDLHADRSVLRELLEKLITPRHNLLVSIAKLDNLVKRRNELTHSLEGVQKAGLARAFAGDAAHPSAADQIVPHLRQLYEQACGKTLPESPYRRINRLLASLLQP